MNTAGEIFLALSILIIIAGIVVGAGAVREFGEFLFLAGIILVVGGRIRDAIRRLEPLAPHKAV